ncbi:hypothetical protein OKW50_008213 [Paraburkholderia youngii]
MRPVIVRFCAIPLPAPWGGAGTTAIVARMAAVHRRGVAEFHRLCTISSGALFRWLIEQRYVLAKIRFPSQLSDALVPVFSQ